ncbi:MAG: serine hydrolase [Gemmatimonadetes bacterium]|nr:serine hydrolase [Gemmatimonadota bacterium]
MSTPAAEGLDETALIELDGRIQAGDYGYVDRVVVVRHGRLVFDRRYEQDYRSISRGQHSQIGCGYGCEDPAWDHQFNYLHPDWHPYHQGRDVHTLQSVTKSITATLIGIAIVRGDIAGVDEPLLPFLAGYDVSGVEAGLKDATLEDVLTMRTGIEWHETDRPMDDTNTTIQLERATDWVQFTLNQPMDSQPGERWAYNSGGSQLMSAVIRHATGRTLDLYAEEFLFGPLDITDYHWKMTDAGLPDALGGLYLGAEDLAKIGYLYLQDGLWEDGRLLPDGWVEAATTKHVAQPAYGYQWWRPDPFGEVVWAGQGFGGQFLLVLPEHDIVAVINSWNLFGGRFPSLRDALIRTLTQG